VALGMNLLIGHDLGLACRQCGKALGRLPAQARHKRFCSRECRLQWHNLRTRKARTMLAQMEQESKEPQS
jgi:predicted nucleic acid-binding Zn ribbon protein